MNERMNGSPVKPALSEVVRNGNERVQLIDAIQSGLHNLSLEELRELYGFLNNQPIAGESEDED